MKIICAAVNAKYIHKNLGIRYLKAYTQADFEVELVEYTIKDPVINIVSDLIQKKPDFIGFSCYIWNIEEILKIIEMIKKINPSIILAAGGPEVSYDVYEWMEKVPQLDYIMIGEGELTFKQLISALENNTPIEDVRGIAYRKDGKIKFGAPQEKLDLKTVPSPHRFKEDIPDMGKRIAYVETSRGCPFSCQFCLSSIEVGVRYFDREKVKDDIRYMMEHGAKTIKFVDRTFNISRSYAMDMFQFLIDEHKPGVVFQFEITADIMRPEVIEFLNENAPEGLFRFEIGVQSTNDLTNDLVKRRQNFEKLTRTVSMVKDGGKIDQHLDLIAGLPKEDYESFKKTFNDVFALRPEELQLGFLKMLRGTGLRNEADKYDYIYSDSAPYEILGNDVLSFDDIIRIKQVEDVLEKYWNDHRMNHTIEYLVTTGFATPFDFFQDFGTYWESRGWSRIGHQLEDLFARLYEFLHSTTIPHLNVIESLMKYDYLGKLKYKPRKNWWWTNPTFEEKRSSYYRHLVEKKEIHSMNFYDLNLSEKDIYKHVIIENFAFDLIHYIQTNEIIRKQTVVAIYFDAKQEKSYFYQF